MKKAGVNEKPAHKAKHLHKKSHSAPKKTHGHKHKNHKKSEKKEKKEHKRKHHSAEKHDKKEKQEDEPNVNTISMVEVAKLTN